jgi:SAM-dependent methyltransferase
MKKSVKLQVLQALQIALIVIGGLLFFWLVLLKLISRLMVRLGKSMPCPASLGWLVDNPVRRRYIRPVLDRVSVHPGERVLELGPGPGIFTVEAAQRVGPEGRLIVVDIQPQMIARVEKRVQEAGLTNVETHVADAYDLPLEDESIDRAFLITVLPEVPDPYRALDELNRVLKPGGLLSITEEFTDPDYMFPFETVQRVEAMGFTRERFWGNFWIYTLNFCKSEGFTYD